MASLQDFNRVDGMDKLAPHSAVRCSVPEMNGPFVQREFTSLLRETCRPSPSETAGTAASNDRRAGTGVSRGHSTASHEPGTKRPDGLTTREGLNLASLLPEDVARATDHYTAAAASRRRLAKF